MSPPGPPQVHNCPQDQALSLVSLSAGDDKFHAKTSPLLRSLIENILKQARVQPGAGYGGKLGEEAESLTVPPTLPLRWILLTTVGRPFMSRWHSTITAGLQRCKLGQVGSWG